jgi:exodeoxyribonuclease VII large subunit
VQEQQGITLFELNQSIKNALQSAMPASTWIIAEISELNVNRTGHCYLELIEKSKEGAQTIAKARATIWSSTYRMLKPYFETTTGHEFSAGLKVLLNASVEFHEVYGISLNIKDIDPAYTIGDIEKRRREIILKLEREGVFTMNKELEFPVVPQRIAIISSATAAGYGDFVDQLENNPYNYKFYHKLFPAVMQGDGTENSIVEALEKIYVYEDLFDVVVIIRGGGSKSDLNSFDSYWIAYNITQFPLPIISGIGHERDDTIVDLVSHTRCKTPTAAAEFLIEKTVEFDSMLEEMKNNFTEIVDEILTEHADDLTSFVSRFAPAVQTAIMTEQNRLEIAMQRTLFSTKNFFDSANNQLENISPILKSACKNYTSQTRHHLEILHTQNILLNPFAILQRGYSVTTKNGKIIKDSSQLNEGDNLETLLNKGKVRSTVSKK